MPEEPLSFRQKLDGKYWISCMREQDKTGLDPYVRWLAANEEKAGKASGFTYTEPGELLMPLSISGPGKESIEAVNESIRTCTSPYIILYNGDIRFAPGAFSMFSRAVEDGSNPDFIYCDEDRIDDKGNRSDPFFKPGWSPDTLMSSLYVGPVGMFRTELLKEVGGLRREYGSAAYYDLVLRFTERAKRIRHVPKILYHVLSDEGKECTEHPGDGSVKERTRDKDAEVRLKEDALKRRGIPGTVVWNEKHSEADVRYLVQGDPLVSIIIPSKDHYEMLSDCLRSIQEHTCYRRYELIIVDNGSCTEQREQIESLAAEHNAEYLYREMPFNFSAMCNIGAQAAKGEYLLFLNDDIIAIQDDWLETLLGQAQLPHIGAVGAKLLYPDVERMNDTEGKEHHTSTIQHAGILNLADGPVHALMGMNDEKDWYYHRNRVTYNFSAVTGACLLVEKDKFKAAGGMNEQLSIAYNDVALCFRLMEQGYQNCVRSDVVLLHYESASRGIDEQSEEKRERLAGERTLLYQAFPRMKGTDPCYNRNLTQVGNDYSINLIFPEKSCGRMRRNLPETAGRWRKDRSVPVPYAIDCVRSIGNLWEITGWISAGRWKEYLIHRYLILEAEDGEGICFRLNRIRMDDSKLEAIRDEKGELFTPFVWFHVYLEQSMVRPGIRYEIVLKLKETGKQNVYVRTGYHLTSQMN